MSWVDPVQWFDQLGRCSCGCGKAATGKLMGPRNESYGAYHHVCAERRLVKAGKARENASKEKLS